MGGDGPLSGERIRFRHDRALQFHASDVVALERDDSDRRATAPSTASPADSSACREACRRFRPTSPRRWCTRTTRNPSAGSSSTSSTTGCSRSSSARWCATSPPPSTPAAWTTPGARGPWRSSGVDAGPERCGRAALARRSPAPGPAPRPEEPRPPRAGGGAAERARRRASASASIRVEECTGRWTEVDPENWTRLGTRCTVLGQDLLLGHRVYDRAGTFTVAVGPTTWSRAGAVPGRAASCSRSPARSWPGWCVTRWTG